MIATADGPGKYRVIAITARIPRFLEAVNTTSSSPIEAEPIEMIASGLSLFVCSLHGSPNWAPIALHNLSRTQISRSAFTCSFLFSFIEVEWIQPWLGPVKTRSDRPSSGLWRALPAALASWDLRSVNHEPTATCGGFQARRDSDRIQVFNTFRFGQ